MQDTGRHSSPAIWSSIKGVGDYARVRDAAVAIELFGRPCRVIAIEDLIRAKDALGRPKDVLAAQELRAIMAQKKKYVAEPNPRGGLA